MFTGITRGLFEVVSVDRQPTLLRFEVDLGEYGAGLEHGASVSIDGVCQTVVATSGPRVTFEAIVETLRLTTLGALEVGSKVSVERSVRVGDEIGGHDVSGHVVGTGTISKRWEEDANVGLGITVPADWMRFILHKGFIAVDGSSLTIGEVGRDSFEVHLIPETLQRTHLGSKEVGAKVNIELDPRTVAIVETVERVLASRGLT